MSEEQAKELQAAELLIATKTRLGKVVPAYAKQIVAGERRDGGRAGNELFTMLAQTSKSNRAKLFAETPELRTWYDEYALANQDSLVAVLATEAALV